MEWIIKSFDELSAQELYEILSIRSEVFIVEQMCPYQDVDFKDLKSKHLYCRTDGMITAYCRLLPKGISYDEASIGRVLTKMEYRKTGLGRQLLAKAIDYMTNELGEDRIRISAQAYLIKFYESFGFKQVSEIYLEDDIEHTEMLYKKRDI